MQTAAPHSKTIGILGGGQLGLMLSESLCNLGANVRIFEPSSHSPAAIRTPFVTQGSFEDQKALSDFFSSCDRVTYEFEHIPTKVLREVLATPINRNKLWPSLKVLENSQNRIAEKKAIAAAGGRVAHWREIHSLKELNQEKVIWLSAQRECLLKTVSGGYDGKGQWCLQSESDWNNVSKFLEGQPSLFPFVLEERCKLEFELSVIVGRHPTIGSFVFPTVENKHCNGILETTVHPPRAEFELCQAAQKIASRIADAWDVFGLLCVEFFVVRENDSFALLVNEVAPRPHNSGHITRRSMTRSQFDILAQILLDLPIGSHPIAPELTWCMWNTLGDLWLNHEVSGVIGWPAEIISHNAVCEAYLYGKKEARPGRKMGHIIINSPNFETSLHTAAQLRSRFQSQQQQGQKI